MELIAGILIKYFAFDKIDAFELARKIFKWLVRIAIVCGLLAFAFIAIFSIRYIYQSYQIDKTRDDVQQHKANSDLVDSNINAIDSQLANSNSNQKKHNENSKIANNEFNNAVRSDSNRQPSDFRTNRDRFCRRFPADSECTNFLPR